MAKLELKALALKCPVCGEEIDVPVNVTISQDIFEGTDNQMVLRLDPDLTDVWAHAWTHSEKEA